MGAERGVATARLGRAVLLIGSAGFALPFWRGPPNVPKPELGTEEIGGGAGNCAMGSGAVPPRCAYEEEHCHAPAKNKAAQGGPSASNRGEKRILF